MDCSAFYPSITDFYQRNGVGIPFLRVNEISKGLVVITDNTVFLPEKILQQNKKTIAMTYPGDILIAKGGNTLAKVGLVTDMYSKYAVCRDLIILRTNKIRAINKYYLWAFLHCKYGQILLWRSASQTGQPHLTLPSIIDLKIPQYSAKLEELIETIYRNSILLKNNADKAYQSAEELLLSHLGLQNYQPTNASVSIKSFSDSFGKTRRLDAEYYQPKYDEIDNLISRLPKITLEKLVYIKKSIEPGSDSYQETGVPFIRVSDISKYGLSTPDIHLPNNIVMDIEKLYPQKDTILLSKDGSVGIAYKVESDMNVVTSGAILHLNIKDNKVIDPDYLTLVLNSLVVQMQAERDAGGSIIQHWKPSEIDKVQIPILDESVQQKIALKIKESFTLRKQSQELLEKAKRAVEIAIGHNEDAALAYLRE